MIANAKESLTGQNMILEISVFGPIPFIAAEFANA
jgi:hypothetical protein